MKNNLSSPKLWFLLLIIVIQFVLLQGSQILLIEIIQSINPDIDRMSPNVFIPVRVVGHIFGMSIILLFAYRISLKRGVSLSKQFALKNPLIKKLQILIFGISSIAVAYISGKVAKVMFGMPEVEKQAQSFFEQLTPLTMMFHVLVTALFAGFFEEITFRGFFQGHLKNRVGVIGAILIMSLAFGLIHVSPYGIVLSTLMGLWLGIVAWRVGSIWPTILGHIFINSFSSFYMSGKYVWGFPENPPLTLQWFLGILSFLALLHSIWFLCKFKQPISGETK